MTKTELINVVAANAEITKAKAETAEGAEAPKKAAPKKSGSFDLDDLFGDML